MKRLLCTLLCLLLLVCSALAESPAVVTIDLTGEGQPISPLIYGINNFSDATVYNRVTTTAVRQGGNRMSGYNWETNYSNAGSDWQHSSDTYLSSMPTPGYVATSFAKIAKAKGVGYRLTTLQMAGYVAADKSGSVAESQTAPSSRWVRVVPAKGSTFSLKPDLTDGVVYMDEYVNFLITKLGPSTSQGGIQAYSLDNEPALWQHTHSRIHPEPTGLMELIDKSVATAKAVKALDPHAEIYGPALYGYTAYDHLADNDASTEWETIKADRGYNWYLDFYLDEMRMASDEAGVRLLDVLDVHYYSESARVGFDDRLQSVRTLYEPGFRENSWIGQWCQGNLPLLPTIMASINQYYPGTKLAITEYNYGGEDISATIAQVETLGCFAAHGVYSAFIWGGNDWQYNGINLYTNYNGQGGAFGDTLIPTHTPDHSKCVAYAAVDTQNADLTVVVTNKTSAPRETLLVLQGDASAYQQVTVYAIYGDSPEIRLLEGNAQFLNGGTVSVTLPAYCAAMVVLSPKLP